MAVDHWEQHQLRQKTEYLSFICQTEQLQEFSLIFIAWMTCSAEASHDSSDSMSWSLWFQNVIYNRTDSRLTLPKNAMVNQDISLGLWEEWSNLKWKDKLQTAEEWISFSSQVMLMVTVRVWACFQWVETSWQQICGSFPNVKLSWQPPRVHLFKLNRDDRMRSLLWQGTVEFTWHRRDRICCQR